MCVECVCPILGQGGVLVFLLLFPLVTLLFPRPPLYTTHPIRKATTFTLDNTCTHTHTHTDPGGKSVLRRPCFSSYGAVVREMERQCHQWTPAANDTVQLLLVFFSLQTVAIVRALIYLQLINKKSCPLNICQIWLSRLLGH